MPATPRRAAHPSRIPPPPRLTIPAAILTGACTGFTTASIAALHGALWIAGPALLLTAIGAAIIVTHGITADHYRGKLPQGPALTRWEDVFDVVGHASGICPTGQIPVQAQAAATRVLDIA